VTKPVTGSGRAIAYPWTTSQPSRASAASVAPSSAYSGGQAEASAPSRWTALQSTASWVIAQATPAGRGPAPVANRARQSRSAVSHLRGAVPAPVAGLAFLVTVNRPRIV
jgi:hypothetical protein